MGLAGKHHDRTATQREPRAVSTHSTITSVFVFFVVTETPQKRRESTRRPRCSASAWLLIISPARRKFTCAQRKKKHAGFDTRANTETNDQPYLSIYINDQTYLSIHLNDQTHTLQYPAARRIDFPVPRAHTSRLLVDCSSPPKPTSPNPPGIV